MECLIECKLTRLSSQFHDKIPVLGLGECSITGIYVGYVDGILLLQYHLDCPDLFAINATSG